MQIGKAGQLQEWLDDWDLEAPERQHRHVSHLYGLFPSNQITQRGTPDLFAAARRSLELRGDVGTGWSLAWKINLWARLRDGDRAYSLLRKALTPVYAKEFRGGGGVSKSVRRAPAVSDRWKLRCDVRHRRDTATESCG